MNNRLITAIIVTLLFIQIIMPNSYIDDDNPYEGNGIPIVNNIYEAI